MQFIVAGNRVKFWKKIYIVVGVQMTESFGARITCVAHAQTLNNKAHTSCRGVRSSVASLRSRFVYRRQL